MKIIKDYKRNSIGQSWLWNLATLLAIEHKEAAKINYTDFVNDFENAKTKKKHL